MKNIKQKLINIFFDIDFTKAIADGIGDYNRISACKIKTQPAGKINNSKTLKNDTGLPPQLNAITAKSLKISL
jgi:hypothetical protein